MTRFTTVNVGKGAASKVAAICNFVLSVGATAVALQECDVNALSAPGVLQSVRLAGLRLYFGAFDGRVYRTAIVSTQPGTPVELGVQDGSRCCSVLFEFEGAQGPRKVLFVSCYSHASEQTLAVQHSLEVLQAASATGHQWLVLGDFNLVQDERPFAAELAVLRSVRALDDPFLAEGPLVATGPGGRRRLDYGFGCLDLPPVALAQHPGFGDHFFATSYDFQLSVPHAPRGPSRLPLPASGEVSDALWVRCWRRSAKAFSDALSAKQVDVAWQLLSDAAEAALFALREDEHHYRDAVPRSALWSPRRGRDVHKASAPRESVLLVRLRRLQRRMEHLRRVPADGPLRANVARDLYVLGATFPALLEFSVDDCAAALRMVNELVHAQATSEKQLAVSSWRAGLADNMCAQRAWIRRRTTLEDDAHAVPTPVASLGARVAAHPSVIVANAARKWIPLWTQSKDVSVAAARRMFEHVPQLSEYTDAVCFSGEALYRAAMSMRGKSAGPDDWRCEHFLMLPGVFWTCLGKLWQVVYDSAVVPDCWQRARLALIPKPGSSDHRPLSILCVAWRLGAKVLLQGLSGWTAQWLNHTVCGGVPGRSSKDAVTQIMHAIDQGHVVVGQDLSKCFDSVSLQHLDVALMRLGAPSRVVPREPPTALFLLGVVRGPLVSGF